MFGDLDDIYDSVGGFGRYQMILVVLRQWICLSMSANTFLFFAFNAIKPDIKCLDSKFNSTDHCYIRKNCENIQKVSIFHTYAEHFNLICEQAWLDPLVPTLTTAATISVLAGGHLSDKYGRKPVLVTSFAVSVAAGSIGGLSVRWQMLTALLIVGGICYGLFLYAVNTLYIEKVTKRYRSVIASAAQWSFSYLVNSLIAYLTKDWRWYLLTANCLLLPLAFIHGFVLVESPRWLIQKGRLEDAVKALNWIARVNGVKPNPPLSKGLLAEYKWTAEEPKNYSIFDLLANKQLRIYVVLQMMHSAVNYMGVSVIVWNVSALVGNSILQIALYGILRLWVPFFVVWVDWKAPRFGRRPIMMTINTICIYCFTALMFIFGLGQQTKLKLAITILGQTGALLIVSIYWITYDLYNVEMFPTVMRTIAASSAEAVGLVAAMVTPYLLYFGDHYWSPGPYFAVSLLLITSWMMDLVYLPETHGKPLMESLDSDKNKPESKHDSEFLHNLTKEDKTNSKNRSRSSLTPRKETTF